LKTFRMAMAVFVVLLFAVVAFGLQYPEPTGYVNDFASLLSPEQGKSLNDELAAFEEKTSVEIAVVTVPWLGNQSIEEYATGLATEWGVGKRGQNNGVVLLVAPKERKMRIETASGARAILTDGIADRIRDREILPRFKRGNMAQGVIDGTRAIMQVFDAEAFGMHGGSGKVEVVPLSPMKLPAEAPARPRTGVTTFLNVVLGCFVISLVLIILYPFLMPWLTARKYVLGKKGKLSVLFAEAETMARNSDVKKETRDRLAKLQDEFSVISRLHVSSGGVKWYELREKADSIELELPRVVSDMTREIAFAEKARREGPELMKKIPGMIEAAERKISEGKRPEKAGKYLDEARSLYAKAQAQESGMSVTNITRSAQAPGFIHGDSAI